MVLKMKRQANYSPLPVDEGDEKFANGVFEFNITKLLDFVYCNESIQPEQVNIADFFHCSSNINESHLSSVDLSKPIIIAEIAPNRYNIIDGYHRVEKAKRENIKTLLAYRVTAYEHVRFLTSKESYLSYVDYWNDKVSELKKNKL